MKEVSEVIKEYEDNQIINEAMQSFTLLKDRTKQLVKNDLCEFKDIDDLNNYTEIKEYKIPINKDNNLYRLYKNNISDKYYFIFKKKFLSNEDLGIIINFDHLTEEEIQKIESIALEEETLKSKNIGNDAGIFILVAVIYFLIALLIFVLALSEGEEEFIFSLPLFIIAVLLYRIARLMDKVESLSKRVLALEEK